MSNSNMTPEVLESIRAAAEGRILSEEKREVLSCWVRDTTRRPILFKSLLPGVYAVGDPRDPATLRCNITAARAVQIALANPGRCDMVRAADFAAPGSKKPDDCVRNGIKRFADFLEANGQIALGAMTRGIRVMDGYLVAPRRGSFSVITE